MIYKFETSHCPMCRQAETLLRKHNVTYQSVDAEEHDDLVAFYGIRSVPCLVRAEYLGGQASAICKTPQSEPHLINFLSE